MHCCKLNSINFTTNLLVLFEPNIFSLIYGLIGALTKLMTALSKVCEQQMQQASLVGGCTQTDNRQIKAMRACGGFNHRVSDHPAPDQHDPYFCNYFYKRLGNADLHLGS